MEAIALGWTFLGLALVVLATALLLKVRQWWAESGLPGTDTVYTDTGTWYAQAEPLFAPELGLTGRPDYLVVDEDGQLVPVEVKSGPAPREPHFGHVMQLGAYCLLVTSAYRRPPPYGILQYRDRAFAIPFTAQLESDVRALLRQMRADAWEEGVDRDHLSPSRCGGCGHRHHCEQRLI